MLRHGIFIALLLALGIWLRVWAYGTVVSRTPDENVYVYQAKAWNDSGVAGIRSLVAEYKGDAETRWYPPPTRVGMIRLVAMVMRWTGRTDDGAGAPISCAASILSLLLIAWMGIRFLPRWAGAAGLLLYAVLPAELAVARRTWTDALVEFAGLLLIYFVCEVARGSESRIWLLLLAVVGGLGLVVKESMPVPYCLCAVWTLGVLLKRRDWTGIGILVGASFVGMGASLWWLSHQVGSLGDYVGIVTGIPKENAGNPYAIEYASGPRYLLLRAFWIIAPMTSLLGVGGLLALLWRSDDLFGKTKPLVWMAVFAVTYIGIATMVPHWINLRYVGATFGPVCVLGGLGAWFLISAGWRWMERTDRCSFAVIAVSIVLGCAVADYLRFDRYFVRDQMIDLSIKMLVDEHNL